MAVSRAAAAIAGQDRVNDTRAQVNIATHDSRVADSRWSPRHDKAGTTRSAGREAGGQAGTERGQGPGSRGHKGAWLRTSRRASKAAGSRPQEETHGPAGRRTRAREDGDADTPRPCATPRGGWARGAVGVASRPRDRAAIERKEKRVEENAEHVAPGTTAERQGGRHYRCPGWEPGLQSRGDTRPARTPVPALARLTAAADVRVTSDTRELLATDVNHLNSHHAGAGLSRRHAHDMSFRSVVTEGSVSHTIKRYRRNSD